LLWYPLKERRPADVLAHRLRRSGIGKILRAEINLPTPCNPDRLSACGLIIVNPPWVLEGELRLLLPELVAALGPGGGHRLDWLAGER
jgi:23S rRNA (adenine2030-N6)-methyltransferase